MHLNLNSLALFHMSLCTVSAHSHRHTRTHLYSALTMSVKTFQCVTGFRQKDCNTSYLKRKERRQPEPRDVYELIAMSMCIRSLPVASMQVQEFHQLSTKV